MEEEWSEDVNMKVSMQTIGLIVVCIVLVMTMVQAVQIDSIKEQVTAIMQGQGISLGVSDVRIPTQATVPAMVGGC